MLRTVAIFSPISPCSRNLGNQASSLFSLFTTIQAVGGYTEKVLNILRRNLVNSRLSVEDGEEGVGGGGGQGSIASLLFRPRPRQGTESIHFEQCLKQDS